MQFKLGLVALSGLLASVLATPVLEVRCMTAPVHFLLYVLTEHFFAPQRRVDGYVYICTDAEWAGACDNYGFTLDVCSNFPSEFQDDISSVGPSQGFSCNFYM